MTAQSSKDAFFCIWTLIVVVVSFYKSQKKIGPKCYILAKVWIFFQYRWIHFLSFPTFSSLENYIAWRVLFAKKLCLLPLAIKLSSCLESERPIYMRSKLIFLQVMIFAKRYNLEVYMYIFIHYFFANGLNLA